MRCPTSPSSLPLGQGGSCLTKCADQEINDSPAKANLAVLSVSYYFSPFPILSREAQNKRATGFGSINVREVSHMTKESVLPSLKIQVIHLRIRVLGQGKYRVIL